MSSATEAGKKTQKSPEWKKAEGRDTFRKKDSKEEWCYRNKERKEGRKKARRKHIEAQKEGIE